MAANTVHVTIALAWFVTDFPDMFWSNTNRWITVNWVDHDDIFYVALFEGFVYFVSKVSNDNGDYLVMKTRLPAFQHVQQGAQVNYHFSYQIFFRYYKVQDWLAGFNEALF